jgi:putative transposase
LRQEFITPHSPEQNGMVERLIRTLKEQCAHRHRFETLQHASRVIGDWIGFYNTRRPHQALGMKTPAEAYALAARPEQVPVGHYISSSVYRATITRPSKTEAGIFYAYLYPRNAAETGRLPST